MIEFLRKYFFFKIDPDKKEMYRERVMHNDHLTYRVLLLVIMILQAIMFGTSFIKGTNALIHCYQGCYVFLFLVCLLCFIVMNVFYKKEKTFAYFLTVSLTMFSIMLWGAMITLLDSLEHTDLTYLAVAMIACASFICLEPWVPTLASLVTIIIFIVAFATIPQVQPCMGFGFFIGTATIVGVGVIGITFNFYRRIKAIGLEFEVSDLNKSLHGKAYIDDLTNVHNRRYLTEHIDDELHYGTPGTGIMMIDLDHFKNVNDDYGHQVGDTCLSMLGEKLNEMMGEKDGYVVRYGGEEFLVYFNVVSEEELQNEAENLRKTIEKMKVSVRGGNKIGYTISAGLALAKDDISYNDLINEADKALYRAKKTRNTISF